MEGMNRTLSLLQDAADPAEPLCCDTALSAWKPGGAFWEVTSQARGTGGEAALGVSRSPVGI